jgi:hypothetical protein
MMGHGMVRRSVVLVLDAWGDRTGAISTFGT